MLAHAWAQRWLAVHTPCGAKVVQIYLPKWVYSASRGAVAAVAALSALIIAVYQRALYAPITIRLNFTRHLRSYACGIVRTCANPAMESSTERVRHLIPDCCWQQCAGRKNYRLLRKDSDLGGEGPHRHSANPAKSQRSPRAVKQLNAILVVLLAARAQSHASLIAKCVLLASCGTHVAGC